MKKPIHRIPKNEVLKRLKQNINALLFDVDGTLIDVSLNFRSLEFLITWVVMERAIGLDKNEEYQKYFKEWLELSKKPGSSELDEINEKLNSCWKGKHKNEVSKHLYSIPFLESVRFFFDELKRAKGRWITGIVSSAPDFYVREIEDLFKTNYFEACEVELDEQGFLTDKFKNNGLYRKEISLENFCQKFSLMPEQVAYHGDSKSDLEVLKKCRAGIAVNLHKKFEEEVKQAADVALYNWFKHPLLEIL